MLPRAMLDCLSFWASHYYKPLKLPHYWRGDAKARLWGDPGILSFKIYLFILFPTLGWKISFIAQPRNLLNKEGFVTSWYNWKKSLRHLVCVKTTSVNQFLIHTKLNRLLSLGIQRLENNYSRWSQTYLTNLLTSWTVLLP